MIRKTELQLKQQQQLQLELQLRQQRLQLEQQRALLGQPRLGKSQREAEMRLLRLSGGVASQRTSVILDSEPPTAKARHNPVNRCASAPVLMLNRFVRVLLYVPFKGLPVAPVEVLG